MGDDGRLVRLRGTHLLLGGRPGLIYPVWEEGPLARIHVGGWLLRESLLMGLVVLKHLRIALEAGLLLEAARVVVRETRVGVLKTRTGVGEARVPRRLLVVDPTRLELLGVLHRREFFVGAVKENLIPLQLGLVELLLRPYLRFLVGEKVLSPLGLCR